MTGAPDFVDPVVGYRAWHLGEDGLLRGWTYSQAAWAAGVTTAECALVRAHRPPVASCSCGLYALRDPSDPRLDFRGDQVVGAIAAWGDLEVHRTGFRAEHACVVAIAVPERPDDELLDRLERVAARHRVRLVPASELSAEACRHGAPLPDLHPARGTPARAREAVLAPAPAIDAAGFAAPSRGVVPDAHLWVETALGCVVVGATRQFGAAVGPGARLELTEPGARVRAGDRLGTVTSEAGTFAVWAPVGGTLLAVNPRLARADVLHTDPEGAGWLARVLPDAWDEDAAACTWGRAAAAQYAAALARDRDGGADPFADVRLERLRAIPPVRSWGDVVAGLEAERRRGRFPDAEAVRDVLVDPVAELLEADPRLRARLARLDQRVAFVLDGGLGALVLDLRPLGVTVLDEDAAAGAGLRLSCSADTLHRWLTGTLDPVVALRCAQLRSSRPAGETLRALAVLKHLRIPRVPAVPSWHR